MAKKSNKKIEQGRINEPDEKLKALSRAMEQIHMVFGAGAFM